MSTPLGLVLDVDGPLASTITRTVRLPSIASDLAAIANAGHPVVFNTGRSHSFLVERVIPVLASAGLEPDAPVWGVGEKGGSWFSLYGIGAGPVASDDSLRPPQPLIDAIRELTAAQSDTMFWDDTKLTMISVEQHVHTPGSDYLAAQRGFVIQCQETIDALGLGDTMRIHPTIISVDIEHVRSGKALGAERAVALIGARGEVPRRWFTAGDSTPDYEMADWLHARGDEVVFLDVRPVGDALEVPYEVIRAPLTSERAEDDHTAEHLSRLREELGL